MAQTLKTSGDFLSSENDTYSPGTLILCCCIEESRPQHGFKFLLLSWYTRFYTAYCYVKWYSGESDDYLDHTSSIHIDYLIPLKNGIGLKAYFSNANFMFRVYFKCSELIYDLA